MLYRLICFSLLLFIGSVECGPRRTFSRISREINSWQLDGYRHLAYIQIVESYCHALYHEYRAAGMDRSAARKLFESVSSLDSGKLSGKNIFHELESLYQQAAAVSYDTNAADYLELKQLYLMDLDPFTAAECSFDENSMAIDQICYHSLPAPGERNPARADLVFISVGGRRTGMSKVAELMDRATAGISDYFNLYSFTIEAEMWGGMEEYIRYRIPAVAKNIVDRLQNEHPEGKKPVLVLGGYSYGAWHLICAVNEVFTRQSYASYRPDLLILLDPDGELNTLNRLYLVPEAERILHFRGVYITPRSRINYVKRLITGTMDEYPSLEGSQPLELTGRADYRQVIVCQTNGQDISPHNRLPQNILEYRDEGGRAVYLEILAEEFKSLASCKKGAE